MSKSENGVVRIDSVVYTCGRCAMFYYEYNQLVAHLYWRHGTESRYCNKCGLRRWCYAVHMCHVLPTDGIIEDSEVTFCFCGKENDSPMIGCDSPECALQWYHFKCVGIVEPPDGNWFCPNCQKIFACFTQVNINYVLFITVVDWTPFCDPIVGSGLLSK